MRRYTGTAFGLLMVALAGCSDSTGPLGEHQLQIEVRAVQSAAPATVGPALAPGVNSLQIETATLVLGGLKLETAGLDETVDWIHQESVVIELDLAGDPTLAFDVDVDPGTYKELEISLDKLEAGHPDEQALIDLWPGLADASIHVSGTLDRDGSPESFEFAAPLDIDLELPFAEALAVTSDEVTASVFSMSLELSQWFEDAGGLQLDPNDSADRSEIEAAITRSIEVLKES